MFSGRHRKFNLMGFNDLTYAYSFYYPFSLDETGQRTDWGYLTAPHGALWYDPAGNPGALGTNPSTGSLISVGHDQANQIGEITIPASAGTATTLQVPKELSEDLARQYLRAGSNMVECKCGGVMRNGSELYMNYYEFYDGGSNKIRSLWKREYSWDDASGTVTGGFRIGNIEQCGGTNWVASFTGGNFTPIPTTTWQTRFDGDHMVGLGCTSVIGRTSGGPAAAAFYAADVAAHTTVSTNTEGTAIAARKLLHYPDPTVQPSGHLLRSYGEDYSAIFNGVTTWQGMAMPYGWDTVLFFGRGGRGCFCYGGAYTPTATQNANPLGVKYYCGSRWGYEAGQAFEDGSGTAPANGLYAQFQGAVAGRDNATYAEPYVNWVAAYRASDLWQAKLGNINPWDIEPYGVWPNPRDTDDTTIAQYGGGGVAHDVAGRRIFVSKRNSESSAVDVYTYTAGTTV
jgi:hypothetical protein